MAPAIDGNTNDRLLSGINRLGPRALSTIAADIRANWKNVYFGAVPYLDALSTLTDITDYFYADDAKSIVLYFLANATTWRGDTARRIKAELKSIAGVK